MTFLWTVPGQACCMRRSCFVLSNWNRHSKAKLTHIQQNPCCMGRDCPLAGQRCVVARGSDLAPKLLWPRGSALVLGAKGTESLSELPVGPMQGCTSSGPSAWRWNHPSVQPASNEGSQLISSDAQGFEACFRYKGAPCSIYTHKKP